MKIQSIGVSGTRFEITGSQRQSFHRVMGMINPSKGHHGDCKGGDRFAHRVFQQRSIFIVVHPPIDDKERAWCKGNEMREPKDYIPRNHDIVDETDGLIAMPYTENEVVRSGTWATVRYARQLQRPIFLILPSGKVETENYGPDVPIREKSYEQLRQERQHRRRAGRIRAVTFT